MGCVTQKAMITTIITKECEVCKRVFEKPVNCSVKNWTNRKVCSRDCSNKYWLGKPNARKKQGSKNSVPAWNKGLKSEYPAWNKGNSEYAKALGFGKWMNGKKLSVETRQKQRDANLKLISEGKHNFYIDGRTPERKLIRHSLEYKLWREAVFAKCDYSCQECGTRGCFLEAHHIKPFAFYPELRFAIDNGIALCVPCHAKLDPLRANTIKK